MATRTPDEIRAAIEQNRKELAVSIGTLKAEVAEATDWRKHLVAHQQQVMIGAAATGFVLTGGLAAIGGLFRRKRS